MRHLLLLRRRDLHFGEEQNAWILSRHADVVAALRSKHLSQTGPVETTVGQGVNPERQQMQSEVFSAFLNSHLAKWQVEIDSLASVALQTLPINRPIDLLAEFIRPWCLASAVTLTGVNPIHSPRLAHLVSRLSIRDAAPHDAIARSRAKEASRELDNFFPWKQRAQGKSMFLGVAQTVPAFLASAWAALVQYPSEWTSLRLHRDWIPKATEELLRYAGPVHSLFRKADSETSIRNTRIAAGDRWSLRLASANRDPLVFAIQTAGRETQSRRPSGTIVRVSLLHGRIACPNDDCMLRPRRS